MVDPSIRFECAYVLWNYLILKKHLLLLDSEGLSIADVQRKLREELEVSMTYMDVRFLIDDLDVAVVEEVEEVEEED